MKIKHILSITLFFTALVGLADLMTIMLQAREEASCLSCFTRRKKRREKIELQERSIAVTAEKLAGQEVELKKAQWRKEAKSDAKAQAARLTQAERFEAKQKRVQLQKELAEQKAYVASAKGEAEWGSKMQCYIGEQSEQINDYFDKIKEIAADDWATEEGLQDIIFWKKEILATMGITERMRGACAGPVHYQAAVEEAYAPYQMGCSQICKEIDQIEYLYRKRLDQQKDKMRVDEDFP